MKAVVFDLDGVICFTDEYHYGAWKAFMESTCGKIGERAVLTGGQRASTRRFCRQTWITEERNDRN